MKNRRKNGKTAVNGKRKGVENRRTVTVLPVVLPTVTAAAAAAAAETTATPAAVAAAAVAAATPVAAAAAAAAPVPTVTVTARAAVLKSTNKTPYRCPPSRSLGTILIRPPFATPCPRDFWTHCILACA